MWPQPAPEEIGPISRICNDNTCLCTGAAAHKAQKTLRDADTGHHTCGEKEEMANIDRDNNLALRPSAGSLGPGY